jgi:hypothetical protein
LVATNIFAAEQRLCSRLSRRDQGRNLRIARGGSWAMLCAMFEKIKEQLPAAADKVAHLRRFL